MKTFLRIIQSLILLQVIKSQITLIESFNQTSTPGTIAAQGWQLIGSINPFQDHCGTLVDFDPAHYNSDNFSELQIDIQQIEAQHTELQISYQMGCTLTNSTNGDKLLTLLIDEDIAYSFQTDDQAPVQPCFYGLRTQNISFTYPHSSESLSLKFNITEGTNEYCYIRNLVVQSENSVDPQYCFDQIGNLTDSDGTTLMNNTCTPYVNENEQIFNFTTSFLAPYELDTDCFSLKVQYSNTTLQEGSSDIDEWNFDLIAQEINWSIKLDDFVDKYNCSDYLSTDSAFIWLCEYQVNIYHQSILQLEHKAKIQVTIYRNAVDDISLVVLPNQVEGACCENQLNVITYLNICEDFTCQNYTQAPYQFQRSEPFYVEQIITNPEFDHYYLKYVEAKLGPVLLQILEFDASTPGKLRLKLQSSIALSGNVLQVISQLHNVAYSPLTGGSTRLLMSEQEALKQLDNNDYKIASYEQIDVVNEDYYNKQNENEDQIVKKVTNIKQVDNSKNTKQLILLGVSAILFLAIVSILAILFAKYKRNQSKQDNTDKQFQEAIGIRIDSQEQELNKNKM